MFKKLIRYIHSPYYAFGTDIMKSHPHWMRDKYYLRVLWKQIMGYPLNLKNPRTFTEKLQWIKLYDRNPLYSTLVDKYKVKQWVAERIGAEHVIPTLAVYNSVDEIDLSVLPNQFVLKCNHDSGSVVICRDKSTFDFASAKQKLLKAFNHNFYWDYREWPYKKVERKIFAEEYMTDMQDNLQVCSDFAGLRDYKFFCFHGVPKLMYIATDKAEKPTTDFFDMEFNHLPIRMKDPNADVQPSRPLFFEQMKFFAGVLSQNLPEVRIDFYETADNFYFGEMTFFHSAGFTTINPSEWNTMMGNWI